MGNLPVPEGSEDRELAFLRVRGRGHVGQLGGAGAAGAVAAVIGNAPPPPPRRGGIQYGK